MYLKLIRRTLLTQHIFEGHKLTPTICEWLLYIGAFHIYVWKWYSGAHRNESSVLRNQLNQQEPTETTKKTTNALKPFQCESYTRILCPRCGGSLARNETVDPARTIYTESKCVLKNRVPRSTSPRTFRGCCCSYIPKQNTTSPLINPN